MSRKLSQEEFEAEVFKMYGNEYTVKSEYIACHKPITAIHNKCGNIFTYTSAINFKKGKSKCPYCNPCSNSINNDVFKYRVNKLVGNEYTTLSEYECATKKVRFRHNNCCHPNGYFEFDMTPNNFFCGNRCPYETHQHKHTIDDFKERLFKYHPKYECIDDTYINSSTHIRVKCEKNHIFNTTLDNIKNNCPYCSNSKVLAGYNDLWTTHPEVANLLKNPEDGYKYMYWTKKKLHFMCPNCKEEIYKIPSILFNNHGSIVCICNDGFSYPEKFFYNVLKQLGVDFVYQLTSSTFKWCGMYRYDFYIPKYKLIVETHGLQHYRDTNWATKSQIEENDDIKMKLAIENGLDYCVIDTRRSEKDFIKESILNSKLSNIFDLSNIDWDECDKQASGSLLFEIVELWNKGVSEAKDIAKEYKIAKTTVYKYLQKGSELGLCEFNWKEYAEYMQTDYKKRYKAVNSVKVQSVETGIIYQSIAEAKRLCKAYLSPENIGDPNKTSAKQHWIYVD